MTADDLIDIIEAIVDRLDDIDRRLDLDDKGHGLTLDTADDDPAAYRLGPPRRTMLDPVALADEIDATMAEILADLMGEPDNATAGAALFAPSRPRTRRKGTR